MVSVSHVQADLRDGVECVGAGIGVVEIGVGVGAEAGRRREGGDPVPVIRISGVDDAPVHALCTRAVLRTVLPAPLPYSYLPSFPLLPFPLAPPARPPFGPLHDIPSPSLCILLISPSTRI